MGPLRRFTSGRHLTLATFLWLTSCALLGASPDEDLVRAAKEGNLTEARQALQAGAKTKSATAGEAMIQAANKDDREMIDLLIGSGVPADQTNASSENALMQAAFRGHLNLVSHLLERGSKATFVGGPGSDHEHIALIGAVKAKSPEITRLLLEHGADPNRANQYAVELALMQGDVEIYQLLRKAGGKPWSVHPAIQFEIEGAKEAAEKLKRNPDDPAKLSQLRLTELLPNTQTAPAVASAHKIPRLAIIPDAENRENGDLLTVELSSDSQMQLVERTEIDRILSEQKLSAEQFTDPTHSTRLGKMAGADALLLLKTREIGGVKTLEARLVRTNPGLVLDSVFRPAALKDASTWARDMAARIRTQMHKAISKDAVALSLLPLRATIGGEQSRELENSLTVLLADRLVHEPHFHILERTALKQLAEEAELKADGSSFWSGAYFLDGSIDPDLGSGKSVSLILRLQPAKGGDPLTFTAKGSRGDLAELMNQAVQQLNGAFNRTPQLPAASTADEAARFTAEAEASHRLGLYDHASQAADAAWVLGARSPSLARIRVESTAFAILKSYQELNDTVRKALPWMHGELASCDLLNHPFRPAKTPSAAKFLELASRCIATYREELENDRLSDDDALRTWLSLGKAVTAAGLQPVLIISNAEDRITHAEQISALKQSYRQLLDTIIEISKRRPAVTAACAEFIDVAAAAVPVWTNTPAERRFAVGRLLALHFEEADLEYRVKIRSRLRSWRLPYLPSVEGVRPTHSDSNTIVLPSLRNEPQYLRDFGAELQRAADPEDRLYGYALNVHAEWDHPKEQLRHMRGMFACIQALIPRIQDNPSALEPILALCNFDSPFGAYSAFTEKAENNQLPRLSAELRAFQRSLFIALCKNAKDIRLFRRLLLDLEGTAPEELTALREVITTHLAQYPTGPGNVDQYATMVRRFVPAPEAPQPSAISATLAVAKFWTPDRERTPFEIQLDHQNLYFSEGSVWIYGTASFMGDRLEGAVYQIELPSLRATRYPLPELVASSSTTAAGHGALLVSAEYLCVGIQGFGLMIQERKTGRWKTFPDLHPSSNTVRAVIPKGSSMPATPDLFGQRMLLVDGDLYMLIDAENSTALTRIHIPNSQVQILASTRRKTPKSPLDREDLVISSLRLLGNSEIEVNAKMAGKDGRAATTVTFLYSPGTGNWAEIVGPFQDRPRRHEVANFPGFSRVGCVYPTFKGDGKTLTGVAVLDHSLPPEFGVPVEFTAPPFRNSDGKQSSLPPHRYGWVPAGFIFVSAISITDPGFWFFPQEEFETQIRKIPGAADMAARMGFLLPDAATSAH